MTPFTLSPPPRRLHISTPVPLPFHVRCPPAPNKTQVLSRSTIKLRPGSALGSAPFPPDQTRAEQTRDIVTARWCHSCQGGPKIQAAAPRRRGSAARRRGSSTPRLLRAGPNLHLECCVDLGWEGYTGDRPRRADVTHLFSADFSAHTRR